MTEAQNTPLSKLKNPFEGVELFLDLLLKLSFKNQTTILRFYSKGGWHQISGKCFVSHLGKSCEYWNELKKELSLKNKNKSNLLFFAQNTYHSYVALFGALLSGLNVMCAPHQMSQKDLLWCKEYFNCVGIAVELDDNSSMYKELGLPVYNISAPQWTTESSFPEPNILTQFRNFRSQEEISQKINCGKFEFISFGHDGFYVPQYLPLDAFIVVANNFLIHSEIPKSFILKSMELMKPTHPFAFLSFFCALIKNGIVGFPDLQTDYETNLRILKPTYIFASPQELNTVCHFVSDTIKKSSSKTKMKLAHHIEKLQSVLFTSKAMKLPEEIFDVLKKTVRKSSRYLTGDESIKNAVEDLRFIVHGLAPASEIHVKQLEQLGIPVIETFGTTHSAGMLSSNSYSAPHFHSIGSALPHVNFRLGEHSILEYRISNRNFDEFELWHATGDVVQMTPLGFMITGRKKHLFVTTGGAVVSPVRLEQLLKNEELISDACVLGDKLPYLSALIVLSSEINSEFKTNPSEVKNKIQALISKINENLPRNVTLKKFTILEKPFSEFDGEKLSNGEINRLKIYENRTHEIKEIYGNH